MFVFTRATSRPAPGLARGRFCRIAVRSLETVAGQQRPARTVSGALQALCGDEFQIPSAVQYAWLRLIAGKTPSLMWWVMMTRFDLRLALRRRSRIFTSSRRLPDFQADRLEPELPLHRVHLTTANALITQNAAHGQGALGDGWRRGRAQLRLCRVQWNRMKRGFIAQRIDQRSATV